MKRKVSVFAIMFAVALLINLPIESRASFSEANINSVVSIENNYVGKSILELKQINLLSRQFRITYRIRVGENRRGGKRNARKAKKTYRYNGRNFRRR